MNSSLSHKKSSQLKAFMLHFCRSLSIHNQIVIFPIKVINVKDSISWLHNRQLNTLNSLIFKYLLSETLENNYSIFWRFLIANKTFRFHSHSHECVCVHSIDNKFSKHL